MVRLSYASTKDSDMRYAVRAEVPDPFFFLEIGDRAYIFLDHREFGVFQEHNRNPAIELVLLNPLLEEVARLPDDAPSRCTLALLILQRYGVAGEPIEVPTTFPLDLADFLRGNGVVLQPTHPYRPDRLRKRPDERDAIRESLRRTHAAFRRIEEVLWESEVVGRELRYRNEPLTSEWLKREVDRVLFGLGMLNVEGLIVSCGPHAAIPHHPGHGPLRVGETIICDIFPRDRASGYFADMTRTYVKGEPSPELVRMYDAVRTAQERAIAAVRPGAIGRAIHGVAVATFRELGYDVGDRGPAQQESAARRGAAFIHGTGHGLGLDVHEEPYLAAAGTRALEVGNVVTVEPGLYAPDIGGVRIEDVVIVTADGCENLTRYPKEFVVT